MNTPARDAPSECAGAGSAGCRGSRSGRFAAGLGRGVTARSGRALGRERSDVRSRSAAVPPVLTRTESRRFPGAAAELRS